MTISSQDNLCSGHVPTTHPHTAKNNSIEEKLRQSEARLRMAGRMTRMGWWVVEMLDNRVLWSDEVCTIHELAPGTQPELNQAINFYAPEYRETISKSFHACAHEGTPYDIELELITAKGNRVWVRAIGEAEKDADGTIRRVQGAFQDITERRRTEEHTYRMAERLITTLESITDAFFTLDRQWRFTYVNHEAERLLQRSRGDLLGQMIWEEFESAVGSTFYKEYHRALQNNCTVAFEEFYHPLDLWVEVKGYPSAEGLAVYFHDVTQQRKNREELRQSEERFQLLSKATNDAIWDWDLITDKVWWNDGLEKLFGFRREEIKTAADCWTSHIHLDDQTRVLDRLNKIINQDLGDSWSDEYRFTRKDGSYAFVLDRGHIIRNPEGQAVRMIGGMTDLTERKKLEQQFLRAQRMESIGTLAGGIAHDLNNVLTPILMSIGLLKVNEQDIERMKVLATIEGSAKRGADMVRQVLSFARGIEEGQRHDICFEHLLQDIEKIANETFLKSIRVSTSVPSDLWSVSGNATQLHQVLLNLSVNARDAMPEGGNLTLSAENVMLDEHYARLNPEARPGPYISIQVEDTGVGMRPEVLEKIFDPFFTTKEVGKGTGLGLSTTLAIIKSHGGFVRVYSEPCNGSKFKVYLPAAVKSASKIKQVNAPELPCGNGELILVVDDEGSVREITKRTLEAFGYRVVVASDGTEAVATYASQKNEIALVLTDLMMPIMDGYATIQILMKMNPRVRVVAASGLTVNGNIVKVVNAGGKHFLSKPYTADTLLKKLKQVLQESTEPQACN